MLSWNVILFPVDFLLEITSIRLSPAVQNWTFLYLKATFSQEKMQSPGRPKALLFHSVPYPVRMCFVYIRSSNLNDFILGLHPLDLSFLTLVHFIPRWREWVSKLLVRKPVCWKSPGDSFMERMAGALHGQREEQSQEGIRSIFKPASYCLESGSFRQGFHFGLPRAAIAEAKVKGTCSPQEQEEDTGRKDVKKTL